MLLRGLGKFLLDGLVIWGSVALFLPPPPADDDKDRLIGEFRRSDGPLTADESRWLAELEY